MATDEARVPLADDTKINMEGAKFEKGKDEVRVEVGQKLIGLTKEELEKYRSDPFWKPVRLVLFALFWILWIAMFAGAILIVVLSPKCAEKQQPKWWQTKVSYQVLVPTFFDSTGDGIGDLAGVTEKLDLLRKIGVTTVYPSPVLQTPSDELFDVQSVSDHSEANKLLGSTDDLKALVNAAHDKDMYVVLDVPLTSVSDKHPWLQHPDAKTDEAFYWKVVREGAKAPANYYDAPARGGKKYLGYPDAAHPVLNWNSDLVRNTVKNAIHSLLDLGVDGFNLDHVSRLAVNEDGLPNHDEAIKRLADLTKDIRSYIAGSEALMDKEIVLFSSLHDMEDLHAKVTETGDLHYTIDSSFTKLSAKQCGRVAQCVHDTLSSALARQSASSSGFAPYWQFSNANASRLASRFDEDTANLLTFMQLSLPGAMSLYYGQELGLRDAEPKKNVPGHRNTMRWTPQDVDFYGFVGNDTILRADQMYFPTGEKNDKNNFEFQYAEENSPLKVYQRLAKLRQRDEILIVGETEKDALAGDVIVFSRFKRPEAEQPAGTTYVVVLNFGEKEAEVELTKLGEGVIPKDKTLNNAQASGEWKHQSSRIAAVTTGVTAFRARERLDLSAAPLRLPPKQGALIRI